MSSNALFTRPNVPSAMSSSTTYSPSFVGGYLSTDSPIATIVVGGGNAGCAGLSVSVEQNARNVRGRNLRVVQEGDRGGDEGGEGGRWERKRWTGKMGEKTNEANGGGEDVVVVDPCLSRA